MDDMQAIEQRISRELLRRAGPSLPVDDLAIFDAVAAASRPQRWGFPMFSAVKLLAAGVIVALFGGFLLAGVLTTQQGDEVVPAAVTESPSPMTTDDILPGVTLTVEEVEPGVFRVIDDGVRDLATWADDRDRLHSGNIVAGLDGSVWLFLPDWFFRLGGEGQLAPAWPLHWPGTDIEVAPDGHLWLVTEREDGTADLITFADRPEAALRWGDPTDPEFRDTGERQYLGVEIGMDGTVYSAWLDAPRFVADYGKVNVGTFVDRGWRPLPALTTGASDFGLDLEVGGHGGIWLGGESLYRLGGSAAGWSVVEAPFDTEQFDVGPDGTLWIQTSATDHAGEVCGFSLARFDGTAWETWDLDDGRPGVVGSVHFFGGCQGGVHAAAPDGSVWLAPPDFLAGQACRGITNFDGITWSHHLDGVCVYDASVAPDGAVWLQAGEMGDASDVPGSGPRDIYVITPEAVAATE